MSSSLWGRLDDPSADAGYEADHPPRKGFFTDTSVCIGCKACEVACKEWNEVPDDGYALTGMSYDNTQALGASTWRHVAFVEKPLHPTTTDLGLPGMGPPGASAPHGDGPGGRVRATSGVRWLMSSDVCKHCTHAACLDVCPTGSLFRTEFGTVVVQPDICNGCGYCVPACPYGVIDLRKEDGRAFKCTLCYDRLKEGQTPACAQACPTESIQFGDLDELRERADRRLEELHEKGVDVARLYGRDPDDGVGGDGAFFLLLDEPEVYGLPPDPVVTTRDLGSIWKHVGAAAATLAAPRRAPSLRRAGAETPMREQTHGPAGGVRVLLRPADPQDADVEDPRRAALPVPRWHGRRLGGPRRGRGAERQPSARAGHPTRRRRREQPWARCSSCTTSAGPERFLNMLRVFKPTSPLSVGSFILAPFSALSGAAAASQVTGLLPRLGRLAGVGAAVFGPPLVTYTAALFANTAVPAWHEAHRELPFVFAGSGASAAGGMAMLLTPVASAAPARRMAIAGAAVELAAAEACSSAGWACSPSPTSRAAPGRLMRTASRMTRRQQRCPCSVAVPGW